jgi:glucokinase
MNHLSIDIGGTKIRVIVYSVNYKILKQRTYKTDDFFKNRKPVELNKLLESICETYGTKFNKIGFSINCIIDKNLIRYSSLLGGYVNIDLEKSVNKYFKFKYFSSDNDVVSMAKAELILGKGKIFKNFLYVNLGTGIRLVAVEEGKIIRGKNNTAGEISQDKVWVEEIKKYIKTDGLISGKGFSFLGSLMQKREINAKKAFNENNSQLISIFIKYLSGILTSATYYYNPELIIIGGSIILSSDKWFKQLKDYYRKNCHSLLAAKNIYLTKIKNPASIGSIIS